MKWFKWFRKVRSVKTPLGEVVFGDDPRAVKNADNCRTEFLRLLLACKERTTDLGTPEAMAAFAKSATDVSDFLRIHHALLPPGTWLSKYQTAFNALVDLQNRFHSDSARPSINLQETNQILSQFGRSIDFAIGIVSGITQRSAEGDAENRAP